MSVSSSARIPEAHARLYTFGAEYAAFLEDAGIDPVRAAREASLPENLFAASPLTLTAPQYYALAKSAASIRGEDALLLAAAAGNVQSFAPAVYAAWCSANGAACIRRLAKYKSLVAPMLWSVCEQENSTVIRMEAPEAGETLPPLLARLEMVLLLRLLRTGTRARILAKRILLTELPASPFFSRSTGCCPCRGDCDSITLSRADLSLPFRAQNEAIARSMDIPLGLAAKSGAAGATTAAALRAVLRALLPAGVTEGEAADQLGLSVRTLQRRLHKEGTTFRQELETVREAAARICMESGADAAELACQLGYDEPGSALRALRTWHGRKENAKTQ